MVQAAFLEKGTVRTGQPARRTTRSATLPSIAWARPGAAVRADDDQIRIDVAPPLGDLGDRVALEDLRRAGQARGADASARSDERRSTLV